MRLSLCLICGNEAALIARHLDSFAPAFDELSLCRAIGATPPDATVEIARQWCADHGRAFIFTEYRNSPEAAAWPHVDDFGAARNMAFYAATGDWLFWADCDDLCAEPERLRAILAETPADLVRFPYDVIGTDKKPLRERAVRRTAFHAGTRWRFAVHENIALAAGHTLADHPAPVWIHQPKADSTPNRDRNRRILSRTLAHSSTNYFYVHQEHFCAGNLPAAKKFGELAVQFPDLDPSFRYEALLNLAKLAPEPPEAVRHALAAHAVFPWCREAIAMLALTSIETSDGPRAAHWAERLLATPLPPEGARPWTHEEKWYHWAGYDLAARCFRVAGDIEAAARAQAALGTPRISLIHASRGRPAAAARCRDTWLRLAAAPAAVEHILCVDADDKPSVRLARQFTHTVSEHRSCVAAWNQGAALARGDLLVQLSDDWVPVPGWDAKLLAELAGAGRTVQDQAVIAISDGHRTDDLLCMAILTRARYEAQGREMFHPGYESVFSDNEFSHRAWRDGVVIDARARLTFHHAHPAFKAAPMDATYAHTNAPERYKAGEALFRARNPEALT